jgi:hypothetical protein
VGAEPGQNPQATAYAQPASESFVAPNPEPQSSPASARVELPPIQGEAAKPATPLKDVTFHIAQSNEKVEVRIVAQAGEVRVAARTDNTDLAHGLRQELSDLSGKLQQSGYHADTWRPGAATESMGSGNDTRKGYGEPRDGQPQSQSGGSQQEGRQQNQNRFQRPRWVEEMESTLKTQKESTGVSHGISS